MTEDKRALKQEVAGTTFMGWLLGSITGVVSAALTQENTTLLIGVVVFFIMGASAYGALWYSNYITPKIQTLAVDG